MNPKRLQRIVVKEQNSKIITQPQKALKLEQEINKKARKIRKFKKKSKGL
ncbi:DUF2992 family protein [Staphylococcus saccharolyticus]